MQYNTLFTKLYSSTIKLKWQYTYTVKETDYMWLTVIANSPDEEMSTLINIMRNERKMFKFRLIQREITDQSQQIIFLQSYLSS